MEVNIKEHGPHTEITLMDGIVKVEVCISDDGVHVFIDKYGNQIEFTIDHTTAADLAHAIADTIDNWRW